MNNPERLLLCSLALESLMLKRLGFEESVYYTRISDYERGKRIPPLPLVLEYAHAAGVPMEDIVDHELDLPCGLNITTSLMTKLEGDCPFGQYTFLLRNRNSRVAARLKKREPGDRAQY